MHIINISSMLLLLLLLPLLFHHSYSATVLVDGVSPWPNPTVHIGDSVIFKHKYGYKLYIFQNQRAFNVCNFTQASLLTNSISNSFTWYPSRPGFYYFTFTNAALSKSCNNKYSQKLSVKVSLPPPPPPVAAPVSGGEVSSSPAYPWPFRPRESPNYLSPAPAPTSGANSPMTMPTVVPADKGGNMPFINSNPAVPLPTGEVDSATIRPLSTSGHRHQVAVGFFGAHITLSCAILLLVM